MENTLATRPPGHCRNSTPGKSSLRISRIWSAISRWRQLALLGVGERDADEAHVRPAVGAGHRAARVAGRADVGEHELDGVLAAARARARAPIASILRAASSSDVPGARAHVDALHRLVDLGEERARQPRRPSRRCAATSTTQATDDRSRETAARRAAPRRSRSATRSMNALDARRRRARARAWPRK